MRHTCRRQESLRHGTEWYHDALMELSTPYLSVVVIGRNEGHLFERLQVFVDGWIKQAKRHGLRSELLVVEWNPPCGRPRLEKALRWPEDAGPCDVRIIEVPAALHERYRYADAIPLYETIARNAAIQRARGEFILVTGAGVLFSDEVMRFLAARRLEKGRLYRIDRHDVTAEGGPTRVFAREGTFPVTAEGFRRNETEDITG